MSGRYSTIWTGKVDPARKFKCTARGPMKSEYFICFLTNILLRSDLNRTNVLSKLKCSNVLSKLKCSNVLSKLKCSNVLSQLKCSNVLSVDIEITAWSFVNLNINLVLILISRKSHQSSESKYLYFPISPTSSLMVWYNLIWGQSFLQVYRIRRLPAKSIGIGLKCMLIV